MQIKLPSFSLFLYYLGAILVEPVFNLFIKFCLADGRVSPLDQRMLGDKTRHVSVKLVSPGVQMLYRLTLRSRNTS